MSDYNRLVNSCKDAGFHPDGDGDFKTFDVAAIIDKLYGQVLQAKKEVEVYKEINKGCPKCANEARVELKKLKES